MMTKRHTDKIARDMGIRAKEQKVELAQAYTDDDPTVPARMPNIGDYRPDGFCLFETFLVDSTGFGNAENEPAMTYDQFIKRTKQGMFYGTIEEGQCQITIGEFKEVED